MDKQVSQASINKRTTEELIKGYWDDEEMDHVPGVMERLVTVESRTKYVPHAFGLMVVLQVALLLKDGHLKDAFEFMWTVAPKVLGLTH